ARSVPGARYSRSSSNARSIEPRIRYQLPVGMTIVPSLPTQSSVHRSFHPCGADSGAWNVKLIVPVGRAKSRLSPNFIVPVIQLVCIGNFPFSFPPTGTTWTELNSLNLSLTTERAKERRYSTLSKSLCSQLIGAIETGPNASRVLTFSKESQSGIASGWQSSSRRVLAGPTRPLKVARTIFLTAPRGSGFLSSSGLPSGRSSPFGRLPSGRNGLSPETQKLASRLSYPS